MISALVAAKRRLALGFLALWTSACVAYAEPVDSLEWCLNYAAPMPSCDGDYVWVGPGYSWPYGVWHPGHYVRRSYYHYRPHYPPHRR